MVVVHGPGTGSQLAADSVDPVAVGQSRILALCQRRQVFGIGQAASDQCAAIIRCAVALQPPGHHLCRGNAPFGKTLEVLPLGLDPGLADVTAQAFASTYVAFDVIVNPGALDANDVGKRVAGQLLALQGKHGIGSGAPANLSLQEIIKKNEFDLGKWKLVESSETAMLAEVNRNVKKKAFVVFLGWTPHPMNVQIKGMHYLKGGEKYFGDTGSVFTLTRKGYAQACPNVGKLLTNLSFTLDMENSIMAEVANKKVSNSAAAKAWIKANPAVLDTWLEGVKTFDGKDGLTAVKARL